MANNPKAMSTLTRHHLVPDIRPKKEHIPTSNSIHLQREPRVTLRAPSTMDNPMPSHLLKFIPTTATSIQATHLQTLTPTLPLQAPTLTQRELVVLGGQTRM